MGMKRCVVRTVPASVTLGKAWTTWSLSMGLTGPPLPAGHTCPSGRIPEDSWGRGGFKRQLIPSPTHSLKFRSVAISMALFAFRSQQEREILFPLYK